MANYEDLHALMLQRHVRVLAQMVAGRMATYLDADENGVDVVQGEKAKRDGEEVDDRGARVFLLTERRLIIICNKEIPLMLDDIVSISELQHRADYARFECTDESGHVWQYQCNFGMLFRNSRNVSHFYDSLTDALDSRLRAHGGA